MSWEGCRRQRVAIAGVERMGSVDAGVRFDAIAFLRAALAVRAMALLAGTADVLSRHLRGHLVARLRSRRDRRGARASRLRQLDRVVFLVARPELFDLGEQLSELLRI